jgi:mannose-1-phosphate guanylyltransferase
MKAVILAGGVGTRLWPLSRKNSPKQVKPFIDEETLLQKTYKRVRLGFSPKDIFISTNELFAELIREQLPDIPETNFILEPERKDTAAAVGLAAVKIHKQNPQEIIVTINSDHYIRDEKEFIRIIKLGGRVARQNPDYTVLIGINPTFPATGYGYIKMESVFTKIGKDQIFRAEKFVEKPTLLKARRYLKNWQYLWNPAYFIWRIDKLLNLYKKYLPPMYQHLHVIEKALGTKKEKEILKKEFSRIKPISIDYGIMEKISKMLVIPANFGWADVGDWQVIKNILSKNEEENVTRGKHIGVDSSGNLIYSLTGKLITTLGVKNMVIIETEDAIMICPKERAQEIKKIIEKLKEEKLEEYL